MLFFLPVVKMRDVFLFSDPLGRLDVFCRPLSMILHEVNFVLNMKRMHPRHIYLNTVPSIDTLKSTLSNTTESLFLSGHCVQSKYIILDETYISVVGEDVSHRVAKICGDKLKCIFLSCCSSLKLALRFTVYFPDAYIICWANEVEDKIAFNFFKAFTTVYFEEKSRYFPVKDFIKVAFDTACDSIVLYDETGHVCIPCIVHHGEVQKFVSKISEPERIYSTHLYDWMTPLQKSIVLSDSNREREVITFNEFKQRRYTVYTECKNLISQKNTDDTLEECVQNLCEETEYCVFKDAELQMD